MAWKLPSCSDEYITFGFQTQKKRKQDYALCVCGGKERGNRLDYILCFTYKGNICIQGKEKKKEGGIHMAYKWVVKAFLYCGTLVKITKSWEMEKDTLGNEERLSASTVLKSDIVG